MFCASTAGGQIEFSDVSYATRVKSACKFFKDTQFQFDNIVESDKSLTSQSKGLNESEAISRGEIAADLKSTGAKTVVDPATKRLENVKLAKAAFDALFQLAQGNSPKSIMLRERFLQVIHLETATTVYTRCVNTWR